MLDTTELIELDGALKLVGYESIRTVCYEPSKPNVILALN